MDASNKNVFAVSVFVTEAVITGLGIHATRLHYRENMESNSEDYRSTQLQLDLLTYFEDQK